MRHISLQSIGLAILITVFVSISVIAYKIESNFLAQQISSSQQKTKKETEQAFTSFIQQQFRLIIVLAEEIVFLREISQSDYEKASGDLRIALPKLQVSYPVNDIRLVNPTLKTLSLDSPLNVDFDNMYHHLMTTEAPTYTITCFSDCYMSVAIPVKLQGVQWALVMTVEMDETLVSFSLLRNINLALLTTPDAESIASRRWQKYNMPILTDSQKTQSIVNIVAEKTTEELQQGVHANYRNSDHFVWQYQYKMEKNAGLNILFIEDTTDLRQEQRSRFIFEVIFIIVLLSAIIIAVVSFISGPVIRLRKLELIVKKTGNKEYTQAIEFLEKNTKKTFFTDEISTVQSALLETTKNLKSYEDDLKSTNRHLERIALYDSTTKLKNRYAFTTQFEQIVTNPVAQNTTLILIDIFGLTALNNNLGHEVGDRILIEVANKLSPYENDSRKAYRFGGDEFMLLCTDNLSIDETILIVEEVLQLFNENIRFDKFSVSINVNIGIACANSHDRNFHKLVSQTAIALNEAKISSKPFQLFTPEMEANSELLFRIKSDFSYALANNEFSMHYQPMLNFWSEKLVKMEALIRWQHAKVGAIYPDQFIPILEETGQIAPLTDWIIDQALQMIISLNKLGLNDVVISVNISGKQVSDLSFINKIAKKLEKSRINPKRIELEITETSLVSDFDIAKSWVEKAQQYGFKVAMDDFGTGYSSLSYLTSIRFDTIKLDRSLITHIATNEKHQNVVTSMVSMIKNLGLQVVIEGVETKEQFIFLRDINCNTAQGYLISKPLDEHALNSTLRRYIQNNKWLNKE